MLLLRIPLSEIYTGVPSRIPPGFDQELFQGPLYDVYLGLLQDLPPFDIPIGESSEVIPLEYFIKLPKIFLIKLLGEFLKEVL